MVELRLPGEDLDELRAGHPTVYLDQNHWSTLAAARHGHRPVREGEAEAALRLAELVEAGRILLPVSAGHLVETTPLYGAPRVALAGTVLSLGRGWQMRNPLHVRVEEMFHAVLGVESVAFEVFAPGADGFFSSVGDPGASPSAKPEMATALEQVGGLLPDVLGLYDGGATLIADTPCGRRRALGRHGRRGVSESFVCEPRDRLPEAQGCLGPPAADVWAPAFDLCHKGSSSETAEGVAIVIIR
ncbi:MAG: hypothetical protein MSC31_12035 [Solirubrobacteraceae bacterium MAG38_C4-C5]|nr:hypothetical protein [Candidatus Siliceabacter maunaloa]